jgi:hypothetical protein
MSETVRQPLATARYKKLAIAVLALVACALCAFQAPAPALASNEQFCTEITLLAGKACHDQVFHKITRVNAEGREWPVCAGALNGNGVEVGGLVCKPECTCYGPSFATNANYDGTKFYEGRIVNNISTWDVLWGLEYYNP